jgi:hypothetical protein
MQTRKILSVVFALGLLCPTRFFAATDEASAKEFLLKAFQLYHRDEKGVGFSKKFLHSDLLAQIDADLKAAGNDDVPVAGDGDLVCDCHEWNGIWIEKLDVKMENPERASAIASFSIFSNKRKEALTRTVKYLLVPEHGQWRIYDIIYLIGGTGANGKPLSLRDQIRDDIAEYTNSTTPK